MLPAVYVWSPPHLFVVLRCRCCGKADVRVRWPERFSFCARCGSSVAGSPSDEPAAARS